MFRRSPLVVLTPGRTETQYVTREVHEHRAPTDESVKLLKEFEDAADKRRIASIQLSDNAFHGKVFIEALPHAGETLARCVFDINGHRITADTTTDWRTCDPKALLISLRDKMARRIADEVLTEFASGTLTKWLRRETGSVRSMSGPTAKPDAQTE